jgi:hypothetical protein
MPNTTATARFADPIRALRDEPLPTLDDLIPWDDSPVVGGWQDPLAGVEIRWEGGIPILCGEFPCENPF